MPLSKSEQMARVGRRNTLPEVIVRKALHRAGWRYRLHVRLPGTPDFVFARQQVAVFVDGCFWHGCPRHYAVPLSNVTFWKRKLERNLQRDRRVDHELVALGWDVVRIWEHEAKADIAEAVRRIEQALRGRKRLPKGPGALLRTSR
jgi:DNA mismatch endonuclease, patch repair protein